MSFQMTLAAVNQITAAVEKQTVAVTTNTKALQLAAQFAVDSKERIAATVNEIIKGNKQLEDFAKTAQGGWLDSLEEAFERLRTNPMMSIQERSALENSISLMSRMLAQFGLSVGQLRGKSDQFYREQHRPGGNSGGSAAPASAPPTTLSSALSIGQLK